MKRADLVTVRRLFSGSARYRCGPARPGFHWSPQKVAQVLVDLENAARDSLDEQDVPEERLYLGVITVCPGPAGVLTILDGQQRLGVITMFLAFARDRLYSAGETARLDRMLVRRAFGRPAEPRLRMAPEDHAWFGHFILPPGATRRLPSVAPPCAPRELLLAARFMEHSFGAYRQDDLRSIVDFLLHHTAMVRSFADARLAAPALIDHRLAVPRHVWNAPDPLPSARHSVAAE